MLEIPRDWFPNWRVAGTNQQVVHIYCNADMHGPGLAALKDVHQAGLGHLLKTFAGAFNIRMTRGSGSFSAHAYGGAWDINAPENPLGATHGGFFDHPEFVACFERHGIKWGGHFQGRKDPMHFTLFGF